MINISTALRKDEFPMFVLCSSLATLGSRGQSNYSAANCFLDSFGQMLSERGSIVKNFGWGLWDGIGMANKGKVDLMAGSDDLRIPVEIAEKVFKDSLSSTSSHVFVMPPGVPEHMAKNISYQSPLFSELVEISPTVEGERGLSLLEAAIANISDVDHITDVILEKVLEITATVTGLSSENIRADRDFQELGLNSLMAVELRETLVHFTGESLPATIAYNYPTPREIAEYIIGKVLDKKVIGRTENIEKDEETDVILEAVEDEKIDESDEDLLATLASDLASLKSKLN